MISLSFYSALHNWRTELSSDKVRVILCTVVDFLDIYSVCISDSISSDKVCVAFSFVLVTLVPHQVNIKVMKVLNHQLFFTVIIQCQAKELERGIALGGVQ